MTGVQTCALPICQYGGIGKQLGDPMLDFAVLRGPVERHRRVRVQVVELGHRRPSGPQVIGVIRDTRAMMSECGNAERQCCGAQYDSAEKSPFHGLEFRTPEASCQRVGAPLAGRVFPD